MATTTKLGFEIVKAASQWVNTADICVEVGNNGGACIQKLNSLFFGNDQVRDEPYCTVFVSEMVKEAANICGFQSPVKTASVPELYTQANNAGIRIDTTPSVGSIQWWNNGSGETKQRHAGIVVQIDEKYYHTIEANTTFTVNGKKYEGIWVKNKPFSAIAKLKAKFIHIEEFGNTGNVDIATNFVRTPVNGSSVPEGGFPSYSSANMAGFPVAIAIMLGALGIGYFYEKHKKKNDAVKKLMKSWKI